MRGPDDATVEGGCIENEDETAYREGVQRMAGVRVITWN